ncbi:MAG TPA: HD domain-containing protein [Patescibacteria group bacterium]|nr:HD domain-containing protein [Patescibacteria group bacterium]
MLKDYHHFKGDELNRSERVQRLVTEMILKSDISDDKRESSVVWELKHHAGCVEIGRILAIKRNLNVELAEIMCVLHDVAAIQTGSYKNHAKIGAEIAKKILEDTKEFTSGEIRTITGAIAHHSDKDVYSDKPYVELVKDADVFECSLYQGAEGFYKLHKPSDVFAAYRKRIVNVREELGLPPEPAFRK